MLTGINVAIGVIAPIGWDIKYIYILLLIIGDQFLGPFFIEEYLNAICTWLLLRQQIIPAVIKPVITMI